MTSATDKEGSGDCRLFQDELNPFDIFPPEVWLHEIIPHVDNAADHYSLYNTCEDLMFLLSWNKNAWIFPQIFPQIYKYLPKNDLLKIRQICGAWMKSVNPYLDTLYHSEFTVFNETTKMFPDHSDHPDHVLLEDGHEIMGLMLPIQGCPHPSIVGGKLVISNARNWRTNEHYISLHDMLDRNDFLMPSPDRLAVFGATVRFLRVDLQFTPMMAAQVSLAQIYGYLQQCLTHLQNIEFFKLTLWYWNIDNNNVNNAQLAELHSFIILFPLPQLPRLKCFEQNFFPTPLSRELENHFLESYAEVPVSWRWKISGDLLPNLEMPLEACFRSLREITFTSDKIRDFDQIKSIRNAPNLATLKIDIDQRGLHEIIDVTHLLQNIQHFSRSLEALWINIWCSGVIGLQDRTPIPTDLKFERVTTLRLDTRERIRYNFLSCFPALERLEIVNDKVAGTERRLRHIQPQRFPDLHFLISNFQVEKSNVWEVLPKLRLIVVWMLNKYDMYVYKRYSRQQNQIEQVKKNREQQN